MRAQNEPAETACGSSAARSTDGADTEIPGAWRRRPGRRGGARRGPRSGRRAAAPSSPGSPSAPSEGERMLDLCAAPGGKATMLAGEVVAVEANEARARELEENVRLLGATNVRVVHADGRDLPAELTRFRPRARRRTLLGSGRARRAARPALARGAAPGAPARARCAQRPRAFGPAGRSSTPSARSTPRSARRSSTRPVSRSTRRSRRSGRSSATGGGRSSCRRCRTSTGPPGSSSRGFASPDSPA